MKCCSLFNNFALLECKLDIWTQDVILMECPITVPCKHICTKKN